MIPFAPMRITNAQRNVATWRQRYAEDGYLLLRNLLDASTMDPVRHAVLTVLKRYGFVRTDAAYRAVATDRKPAEDVLAPNGPVLGEVAASGVLGRLSHSTALLNTVRSILGGDIFAWRDGDARLRIVPGAANTPAAKFSTPPHQDYYFFRPIRFCTAWIPLTDIKEDAGGLALRESSHRSGLQETWWHGKSFLGVATTPDEAQTWCESGAVPVAGDVPTRDAQVPWLRCDFKLGDVLLFDSLMLHAGLPNRADYFRLSADFRYQLEGIERHWESVGTVQDTARYFANVTAHLDSLQLPPGTYEHVWEQMRLEGPKATDHGDIPARVANSLQSHSWPY